MALKKSIHESWIFLAFWGAWVCAVRGAALEGMPIAYVLDHQSGFSASFPSAIAADRDGRLWVSSDLGGLFVGDGLRFLKVDLPPALTGRSIGCVAAGPAGRLWVLSSGGLGILEKGKWQVEEGIRQYEPAHASRIDGIFCNASGMLAVMASGHAYRILGDRQPQAIALPGEDASGEAGLAWMGNRLAVSRGGRFWIEVGNTWASLPGLSLSLAERQHGPLLADGAGHLYLLTDMHLYHLAPGAGMWRALPDVRPDNLSRMALLQDGGIWILQKGRLMRGFRGIFTSRPIPLDITLSAARALCLDREGNIWISNGSLVRLPAWGMVRVHAGPGYPPRNPIWRILRDQAGRLWVSSEAGLFRQDSSGWRKVPGVQMARSMEIGPDDRLYVCDRHNLIRVEMQTLKTEPVRIPPLTAGIAVSRGPVIQGEKLWVIDALGRLILGSWGKEGWTWTWDPLPEMAKMATADIMKDDMGRPWAIFADQVYCRVEGKWEKLPALTGSRGGGPMGVSFRTEDEGLVAQYDPPAVLSVRRSAAGWTATQLIGPDQLRNIGVLYSIGQDKRGTIWIGSDRGVIRVEPGDPPRFQQFGSDQGLPSDDTDQGALLVEGSEHVWVGTVLGLAELRVNEIGTFPALAAPSFLEVHRGSWKAQGPAAVLDIQYGRGPISWELGFSGPAAGHGGRFEFRKASGPWTALSGTALQFPMIPSGHHTYEVRILPANGPPGPPRRLDIYVHPPWYQQPLAYLAWGMLTIGLIFLGSRWRFALLRRRNRELNRKVLDATKLLRGYQQNLEKLVEERTSKLVRATDALQASEARYQLLFDNAKDGMALAEAESGRLIDCNITLCRMVGRGKAELVGQPQSILHPPPSSIADARDTFKQHRNADPGVALEDLIQTKDGRLIAVEIRAATIRMNDRDYLLGIFRDITERKKMEVALRDSEKRYRHLFDASPTGIVLIGPDGRIIQANDSESRMFGYGPPGNLIGVHATLLVAPSSRDLSAQIMRRRLNGEEVPPVEYELIRKDGTLFYGEVSAAILRNENGAVLGYICITSDTTERKLAEDKIRASLNEKEVLLQEIHHRVKNNLQIISGLLTLQADQAAGRSLDDIFQESQDRIRTIALIHEKLYSSHSLAEIDFDDYLRTLTRNLFSSHGIAGDRIAVRYKMEDMLLTIEKAIPLGLIANELISNALKHAFPGGRRGEIRIRLRQRRDESQHARAYELIVTDNGVGLPGGFKPDAQKSLGMHLIVMLANQLQATLTVKTAPGAEFRLLISGLAAGDKIEEEQHDGWTARRPR